MHNQPFPKDTWVIIPAFNEGKYLANVLKKVLKYSKNIVVVDDGSRDQTTLIAQKYLSHVLTHKINLGKGAALKTGCEFAFKHLGAKAVIFLDGDDQHNPQELALFGEQIHLGHQIIFGERKMGSEMPLFKIIGNRFASFLLLILYGKYIPDIPSGFKAISAKAYKQIQWQASDYSVEMEIAVRVAKKSLPFKVVQVETIYHDFDHGMTIIDVIRMSNRMITWRFSL